MQDVTSRARATLVLYDTDDDRLRRRLGARCADAGLRRVQYSVWCGALDAARREALSAALLAEVTTERIRLLMLPLSARVIAGAVLAERGFDYTIGAISAPFAEAAQPPDSEAYNW